MSDPRPLVLLIDEIDAQGVEQTRDYVDRCGAEAGHLVVFDRDPERSWEEKIFRRASSEEGVPVTVWGM